MARTRAAASTRDTGRAANGTGSVVARTLAGGSTVYDVYWSYRDVDGNRRRGVKNGFSSFRDAEKHRRTVTATVDTGGYVPPVRMTVAEYLTEWLEGLRLKPQTLAGYRRKIRLQVLPAIGHLPLAELRVMHLNELYRQLEQRGGARGGPLSLTTVREVHNILSSAYSDAVKSGLVADSPTRRADPPTERECKARRPEMHAWTAEQLRAFLVANAGDHYLPIWHVAAATGLRRGEVLGLRWDDVDLDTGRLSVRRSLGYADTGPGEPKRLVFGPVKNHAAYVVHLDTTTVTVLRQHRVAQAHDRLALGPRWVDQDLVFARGSLWLHHGTHAGGPLDPERVSVSFQAAVARSGVQRIRLHSHVVGGMDAEAAQTVADLFTVTEEVDEGATAVVRPRWRRRSSMYLRGRTAFITASSCPCQAATRWSGQPSERLIDTDDWRRSWRRTGGHPAALASMANRLENQAGCTARPSSSAST